MFNWKEELIAENAIFLDKEDGGKGRQFKCRFLVPGLVKYDYGVCLLTKENADKFIEGFIGCPVVINHQDVTDANVKEVSVGNIFSVWFDEKDGYFWCNGIITDKKAIELINKGYSVSCQYTITEYSDNTSGALHNGNPYDKIIENGKPEHLAIVNNPRYEGAKIAVNAIMAQNEDKWITIHPNGEENKGRHLLLKDGESVEDAMHRNGWYEKRQAKEDKKEDKNDRVAARHKHQEAIKKHQKVYEDFEKGIGTFEDIEKADKELQKANEEFYGKQPDKEEKGEEFSEDFKKLADETAELEQKYLENPSTELAKQINKNRNKLLANKKYAELMYRKNIATPDTKKEENPEKEKTIGDLDNNKQSASNSFVSQFKDTLYTALAEGIANRLGELIASNEDKWITIHPHGEESDDYRRLLIKDGETVEDAMHRQGYYNKRQAKDEKQKKELEEKIKQLLEKARRIGGEKTVLGQKYLKQAEELKKGNLEVEEKETIEKDNKKQASLQQSKHFEKFNKISDEEKKAHDEWAAKQKEYNDELEKNKEYKELEKKIVELRKQIMTTDYRDKEKYLSLQAAKNELQKRQNDIRGEVEKRVGLYDAQHKWSDIYSAKEDERKNLIKNSSNDIKQQINKISSRNDKVVKSFDSLKEDSYIVHKNKEYSLKKEYDDLLEKYSKMEWGTDEYKATYQKAKEKQAEYQSAYWQSKKMLADFAPKISKILQVENGLKFETKAENKAMEENAKRLKEVLDGIIPNNVLNNKPININQTGKVRAFQSGQSINLHNEERIGTIIHETAHQLEENNPQMLINSLAFAKSRTEGEKQKALKKFNSSYTRDEYCKPDKFFDPYCGKLYTLFGGRDRSFVDGTASEIMSMGLQRIFEDPINFAKEDREYFDFVLSNLRGELWD